MTLMKYLSSYSGKDDPEIWLESYYAAAESEKWSDDQILECIRLNLKRKAGIIISLLKKNLKLGIS